MDRARNISKSMMSYLKRAREQKEFLLKETKEFERGKRHLANMMGLKSDEMNQEDIDEAITYLFPSGLFDKKARPSMKHPDLLYKAQKEAQFDVDGRPHHYLFYTVTPNYHECLSELAKLVRKLNQYEDKQLARGILDPPDGSMYQFTGKEWLSHEEMCDKFLEKISGIEYEYLIRSLEQLCQHPYSNQAQSFIDSYSKNMPGISLELVLPEILKNEETGEIYTNIDVRKREHVLNVRTVLNGSGKIDIEGRDILYIEAPYMRRAILFPLQLSGMLDRVDIYAKIIRTPVRIGDGAYAGAIRNAVSCSIAAYVDPETRERLRLAGLLTTDTRTKERKKFGQEGARRKYTWKKR